jgi:hypothetical protein
MREIDNKTEEGKLVKLLDEVFEEKIDEDQTEHYRVTIEYKTFDDDPETIETLYIKQKYLPLYPNSNNVTTEIEIKNTGNDDFVYNEIKSHDGWGGTGLDYSVELTKSTDYGDFPNVETPWLFDTESLEEWVKDIKNYKDFKDFIKNIKDYLKESILPEENED